MPLRYVLFAGLICAAIIFFKRRRYRMRDARATEAKGPIRMVRCEFCGVHIANRDAVRLPSRLDQDKPARYYCSLDHAKQDQLHRD